MKNRRFMLLCSVIVFSKYLHLFVCLFVCLFLCSFGWSVGRSVSQSVIYKCRAEVQERGTYKEQEIHVIVFSEWVGGWVPEWVGGWVSA